MSLEKIARHVDDVIIDSFFQPIADRLPQSLSAWSIAMNCQLGALIFQAVYILIPLIFYDMSLGGSLEAVLVLSCGIILFVGFQRFRTLVRSDMLNPLRPMMRAWRLISIGFLIYNGWGFFFVSQSLGRWNALATLSQLIFVVGLYFMACQPRPPKKRRSASASPHSFRRYVKPG